MNASATAAALSPTLEFKLTGEAQPDIGFGAYRAGQLRKKQLTRTKVIGIGAAALLQAGLMYATFQGLGMTPKPIAPAPFMVVEVVEEKKVLPPPPPPAAPQIAPPQVVMMEVPQIAVEPPPDAITVAAPTEKAQPPAPTQAARPTLDGKAAVATYQSLLLGHLAHHKHYPPTARARRQQGVAYVHFKMDRRGQVLISELAKSSGAALLDQESVELLHRASPLPAPPVEVTGDPVDLIVPIEFYIR